MDNIQKNNQETNIQHLITILESNDGLEREKARKELVKIGKNTIKPLLKLINQPKFMIKWEAMKALIEIKDPTLVPVFIDELDDQKFDIRWMAAEGLINQGERTIKPLLLKLSQKDSDSVSIFEGAHHIFTELDKTKNLPKNFPSKELIKLLKSDSSREKLEVLIYKILNEMV